MKHMQRLESTQDLLLIIVWSEISFVGVQCVDICHQGTQYECEADLILIIIIF